MFSSIDRHLELTSRNDIQESSSKKEWEAAVVREADVLNVKGQGFGNCVFVNFDGGVFTDLVSTASAFEVAESSQKKGTKVCAESGNFWSMCSGVGARGGKWWDCKAADSSCARHASHSGRSHGQDPKDNQKLAKANRRLMKRVHKLGEEAVKAGTVMLFPDIKYEVIPCSSVAALKIAMSQLSDKVSPIKAPTAVVGHVPKPRIMPVFVLEDLAIPGVIPEDPVLPDLEEDDMECALAIGRQEFEEYRARKWAEQRPHQVPVSVPGVDDPVLVYADVAASLRDAWETAAHVGDEIGFDVTWVDSNPDALYLQGSTGLGGQHLQELPFVNGKRLLSDDLREALLWTSVVRAHSVTHEMIQDQRNSEAIAAVAKEENDCESEPTEESKAKMAEVNSNTALSSVHRHISTLFSHVFAGEEIKKVNSLAVLGGNATPAKLRVLDDIINKFSTVMLVGEMALPFLSLMAHLKMPKYQELAQQLGKAAKALIAKARMRGVNIVLPVDAIVSEEKLPEDLADSTYTKFDPEARDEGADYEGDTSTVSLMPKESENTEALEGEEDLASPVEAGPTLVRGYIYDIGPETCKTLSAEINTANLIFVWGVAGVCEVGPFQAGQRTLSEALNGITSPPISKEQGEGGDSAEEKAQEGETAAAAVNSVPKVTIVLGGATVEWCTRFLDSDGELQGDLIACGAVTYASRRASTICGRLAAVPSPLYDNGLMFRESEESEWAYQGKVEPIEEDDE